MCKRLAPHPPSSSAEWPLTLVCYTLHTSCCSLAQKRETSADRDGRELIENGNKERDQMQMLLGEGSYASAKFIFQPHFLGNHFDHHIQVVCAVEDSSSNRLARNELNLSLCMHPSKPVWLYSSRERDTFMVLFVILEFDSPSLYSQSRYGKEWPGFLIKSYVVFGMTWGGVNDDGNIICLHELFLYYDSILSFFDVILFLTI